MSAEISAASSQAMRVKGMTETQLQDGLIDAARRLGFLVYHSADARRSEPGFPDLVIVGHGRILVCECKTQKGRVRGPAVTRRGRVLPGQRDWLTAFDKAGVYADVVRPEATDDAIGYEDALIILQAAAENPRGR